MRKFLCLKDLVMKTDGRIELTAGKLYRETKPIGDRDNAVINNSGKTHNNVQRWGVFVETFERDGVEWIRHGGGDCPVPGDWRVEFSHESGGHVFGRGGLLARLFCWGPIVAYRIISTGEQERQFKSEEHREMVEDAEEFKSVHGDGCCSCHISAPCSYCTHPGNPLCLESAGYDENGNPLGSEQEEPLPIISTYAEAIRSALEEAVSDGLLSPLPDIAESTHRVPGSVTGVDPSPVPAQPIDTTPQPKHTIPAQTVADIDYHPLRLGAAHFLKGEW